MLILGMVLFVVFGGALALVLAIRCPRLGAYGGFLLAGVLLTPELPVVGEKLAPPDIPLLMGLFGFAVSVAALGRVSVPRVSSMQASVLCGVGFVLSAFLSLSINGARLDIVVGDSIIHVLNYLYGLLIFSFVVLLINDWQKWRICLLMWILGVTIVVLVSVAAVVGIGPSWAFQDGGTRISSTFRRVNQLHSFLAPMFPILFWVAITRSFGTTVRLGCAVLAAGVVIALMATGSRTAVALLAFGVLGVLFYSLLLFRRDPTRTALAMMLVVGVALLVSYFVGFVAIRGEEALPDTAKAVLRPIQMLQSARDAEEFAGPRGEQMELVSNNWWRYPVVGVGPGNFSNEYQFRHEVHNSYLGVFMEQGILGLSSLIAFIAFVLYGGVSACRRDIDPSMKELVWIVTFSFFITCLYGIFSFGIRQRTFWLIGALVVSAAVIAAKKGRSYTQHVSTAQIPPGEWAR